MVIHATTRYENPGVTAELPIEQQAPSKRKEVEVWHAAGQEIGRLRVYVGGQETTFGQDQLNDADTDENATRGNALHPFMELKNLYADVRLGGDAKVGGDDVFVELAPPRGASTRLSVSNATSLVLQAGVRKDVGPFADYRNINEEMVAFDAHSTMRWEKRPSP
ncbi:MAG: hypothetical protein ABJC07_08530 [Acidobacteriota bacterium]